MIIAHSQKAGAGTIPRHSIDPVHAFLNKKNARFQISCMFLGGCMC